MFDLSTYLSDKRRIVDQALDHHLPSEEARPRVLHEAMRYTLFSGGKRLRPILCLAAAEALGAKEHDILLPAIALEALHTYSLVHDDLPAMDDDDMRRGQPSAHIKFGEANAILIGDALLTMAFEWTAEAQAPKPYLATQYVLELAEASGSHGIIAGQVEDLEAEGEPPTAERVDFIHLHKTAALIRAAVRIGAIAGGATAEQLDAVSLYGCNIGLAFQIADDLLDETSTTEELGKPVGSDQKNKKMTYVALLGQDGARKKAEQLIAEAIQALSVLPQSHIEPLTALAQFMTARKN